MKVAIPFLCAALLGAGAYAAEGRTDADRLDKALSGFADTGRHSTCAPSLARTLDSHVYGRTILYQARAGGPIYRTETAGGCEAAANGNALVSVQYQGRPCSGDIVRTVDTLSGFTTGSCALGEFTTYERVKR